jgi:hypothetical protein
MVGGGARCTAIWAMCALGREQALLWFSTAWASPLRVLDTPRQGPAISTVGRRQGGHCCCGHKIGPTVMPATGTKGGRKERIRKLSVKQLNHEVCLVGDLRPAGGGKE